MKNRFRFFLLILSLYFFLPLTTFSCFRVPRSFFSPNYDQFLFDGKVIGYTKAYKSKFFKGEAVGVRVSVGELVNLPEKVKIVEVFPFDLESDCSRITQDLKTLQNQFPLNIKVRVIGSKITNLFESTNSNVVQLDTFDQGEFIEVSKRGKFPFMINSAVNYKLLTKRRRDSISGDLLNFELKKELFHLDKTGSESETLLALKRLIYFPFPRLLFPFEQIVKRYLTNQKKADELIELRHNWLKNNLK